MKSNEPQVAVLFIGNTGSGKSTLLSQIGGNFPAGLSFRKGFTTEISETRIDINGQPVVLMDVPGLYEPDESRTKRNAQALTEALKKGYDYKIYFVVKADNRGLPNQDWVVMSKVNECVRQVGGAKVEFRVIINQIMSKKIREWCKQQFCHDNFQSAFESLKMEGYFFDIKISGVLLVMFDEAALENMALGDDILREVREQMPVPVSLHKNIEATNKDVTTFKAAIAAGIGGFVVGAVAVATVVTVFAFHGPNSAKTIAGIALKHLSK
ncbi:hypothetical protein BGZ58_004900 [Dissophora ornata]|nr:hypothetical protein BGZ58_004900 [Dissophora ornata]